MDKEFIKLVATLIISAIAFLILLAIVSIIPEGTPGLFGKSEELATEELVVNATQQSMIDEVPGWLFDDPEVSIETVLATPSQAIEEPLKAQKKAEGNAPIMTYYGVMATTGYVATGNPCADGVYPSEGWTVACNDKRLWHKTIYIDGIGTRYVHDTGGMASTVLDVFVGSISEAYQITSGGRDVYIIE